MFDVYRSHSIEWSPSPVIALATSPDDSQVAAAREDGSVEIWLVSPGSVGWHCQLTIHGDPNSRVSSLIWCRSGLDGTMSGRLLSSSIDGSISEWNLFSLTQQVVLDSIGVSIWQMAASPLSCHPVNQKHDFSDIGNGQTVDRSGDSVDTDTSDSDDDDDDSVRVLDESILENTRVAVACDDGCVRIYSMSDLDQLHYYKSLPRVSGRALSVAWSFDAKRIYSGSSDGFIRCWDARTVHEIYRITVGLGGSGTGPEVCTWSLLPLRCGTLVSADSTGSVQFWDSQYGTLLHAHSCHKGDVNALAAVPSHNRVFSAGSDGQVILYKLSNESVDPDAENSTSKVIKKWVYVGYVRAHTHDVRALTVAVPISREGLLPGENVKRVRGRIKPIDFSYNKWAHLGVPMLISAGDDTKLFAYSAKEFTNFAPHDICPAPQRPPMQLVLTTGSIPRHLLLVQASHYLDIFSVRLKSGAVFKKCSSHHGDLTTTDLVARVKSKGSRKIICSSISSSGTLFAYSDHVKPSLFELKYREVRKDECVMNKKQLPPKLPFAHSMVFSFDSSQLMIAGHDRMIYVVDVESLETTHRFTPCRKETDEDLPPGEPPITKMVASSDGQWLAAINCFGDVYIFNLELQRQHWFISRLDGASVTAAGFTPRNSSILIVSTSSNQVYEFDVDAKQLGEWSKRHTFSLPRRYQDFPGEVIGLAFPPSLNSSSVIIYSARAMCCIDFEMPVDRDEDHDMVNGHDAPVKSLNSTPLKGRSKRKWNSLDSENKNSGRKNFSIGAFREPVLFVGHLSKSSILIVEKPWMQVVKTLDAQPVHRHIYGT